MAPSVPLEKIPTFFPKDYTYKIRSDRILVKEINDEDSARVWLEKFKQESGSTWTTARTYVTTGLKVIFKEQWKCHFKVQDRSNGPKKRKVSSKNLDCPALITATVYRPVSKSKSKLKLDADFPCHLEVNLEHNHLFNTAAIVRYNRMSAETEEKLKQLFEKGYTASSAREQLKLDIYLSDIDNYDKKSADNSIVPTVATIQYMFNKAFGNVYGAKSGEEADKDLEEMLRRYNEETAEGKAVFGKVEQHKYVAICTPIMARAHKLMPSAGELALVDASGNMDTMNHRVYILCTPGPPGGVPLGCIITDVEKCEVFQASLEALVTILPEGSFYGKSYPTVILTDDDLKERKPLQNVWVFVILLLCQFHVLKAHWGWLCESKKKIDPNDRQSMYLGFKKLLHANNEEDLESAYKSHIAEWSKYPHYCTYVKGKYARRKEWADAYRSDLPIRSNDTTNYVEVIFNILKDSVFERVKAVNLTQLVDFILIKYEGYMERRLLDFAHDRYCKSLTRKYLPREDNRIDASKIHQVGASNSMCFSVPSQSRPDLQHLVDAQHGFCTCESGKRGRICAHLNAVLHNVSISDQMFIISPKMKAVVYEIARGKQPDPLWLLPLNTHPDDIPAIMEGKGPSVELSTAATVENSRSEDDRDPSASDMDCSSTNNAIITSDNERDGLKALMARIEEGMDSNPDVFVPAVKKLLKNVEKFVKTDSALVSALHTFGRYSGLATVSTVGSRRGPQIGVQPTSVARRVCRKYSLGGKRRLNSGRRPGSGKKPGGMQEHDYTSFGLLPMNKIRAQHNLQQCVEKNVSVPTKRISAT